MPTEVSHPLEVALQAVGSDLMWVLRNQTRVLCKSHMHPQLLSHLSSPDRSLLIKSLHALGLGSTVVTLL